MARPWEGNIRLRRGVGRGRRGPGIWDVWGALTPPQAPGASCWCRDSWRMQLLTATLLLPGANSSSLISTQPSERTAKLCGAQRGGHGTAPTAPHSTGSVEPLTLGQGELGRSPPPGEGSAQPPPPPPTLEPGSSSSAGVMLQE